MRTDGLLGTGRADFNPIPEGDMRTIRDFHRFLKVMGPPGEPGVIWRNVGWLPYALNFGPAPPEGMEDVPWTAWTLPG